uniref:Uncharacterized protein n=1 Tax=Rhizophora mucronata TaxID=61149 RepID=A0A2P2IZA9_RHIMU
MFPFCRGHSVTRSIDHEPWSFGEEVSYSLYQIEDNCLSDSIYAIMFIKILISALY